MKRSVGRFMTTPAASMRLAPPRAPRCESCPSMTMSMTFDGDPENAADKSRDDPNAGLASKAAEQGRDADAGGRSQRDSRRRSRNESRQRRVAGRRGLRTGQSSPRRRLREPPHRASVAFRLVLRVRGGALALPSFPAPPRPSHTATVVDLHYKDRSSSPDLRAGREPRRGPGHGSVSHSAHLGRSASSNNRLRGWATSGGRGPEAVRLLQVIGRSLFSPECAASSRRQRNGGGWRTDRTLRLLPRLAVTATGTVTWANARYTRPTLESMRSNPQRPVIRFGGSHICARRGLRTARCAVRQLPPRSPLVRAIHCPCRGPARRCRPQPLTEQRVRLSFAGSSRTALSSSSSWARRAE